jgi:electron transfer flavoprotein beta subunit
VITMGPPQAAETLQECIAMGADDAVLLSDRALGGSDTWATSNAIAAGIRRLGDCDIILPGGRPSTAIRPRWARSLRKSSGSRR